MRLHAFDKEKSKRKLKIRRNRTTYIKIASVVLCILAIIIGSLFISYARFESSEEFDIIQTKVGEFISNDIIIEKYYLDNVISNDKPKKEDGYIFDYALCDSDEIIKWDNESWDVDKSSIKNKTTCYLYFVKEL